MRKHILSYSIIVTGLKNVLNLENLYTIKEVQQEEGDK